MSEQVPQVMSNLYREQQLKIWLTQAAANGAMITPLTPFSAGVVWPSQRPNTFCTCC